MAPRKNSRGHAAKPSVYLPLAHEWAVWDNAEPPPFVIAEWRTHAAQEAIDMLTGSKLKEPPPAEPSDMVRLGLEAGRRATEKMLDYYRRMGIQVTAQMTLAPGAKTDALALQSSGAQLFLSR